MVTPRKFGETSEQYLARMAQEGDVAALSADVSDTWRLEQDDDEAPGDYAIRALALGCAADYTRRIERRAL